jgi:hypothetical protein
MQFYISRIEQAARANKVSIDFFSYTATFLNLGVGATAQTVVNISADSDFLWQRTALVVFTTPNVLNVAPDLLVSYVDTGSSRNLQDFPTHVANCTGTAAWPFVLPEAKLLRGNGGLQITVQNLSGIAQARIDFCLHGIKIFYIASYSRDALLSGF